MKRFVILGLPRSGSTYLMTLLDAHRDVSCAGEQFNPYAVIDQGEGDRSHEAVLGRDRDPVAHMHAFFARQEARGYACGGFKFMIGHNLKVLQELAATPDLSIIYLWRENKLAQASSFLKAVQTKKWAQTRADDHLTRKIVANPRQISQLWHEYATFDHLISMWLEALPNPKITYEYREMFQPGFEPDVCEFLGVPHHPRMKSRLIKQGSTDMMERFEDPHPIRYYFTELGLRRWMEEAL